MPKKHFQNHYFFSSLFFAVALIIVLTVKLIFAWNPPTTSAPNPAGQTLYSDSSNNIGIGTLSPGAKLEKYSTSSDSVLKLSRQSATSTLFKLGTDSALIINNNDSDVLSIKNGNIGINTTNPNEKLTIDGSISVQELSSAPSATSGYGKIYAMPSSGNDSYDKLILHANGIGASFIDSSASAHAITAIGNATQSATQSKFGGKSGYFDGTGDYLRMAASSDFAFTGDFTMDVWINTTYTGVQKIWGTSNESAWTVDGWHWGYQNGNFIMEYNGVGAPPIHICSRNFTRRELASSRSCSQCHNNVCLC